MTVTRTCTYCKSIIFSHVLVIDNRDYCGFFDAPDRVAAREAKRKRKNCGPQEVPGRARRG